MKKIITVLLSVLLIAGLFTGCNGEAVEELFRGSTPTPTPTPEPVKYTITFNSNGGSPVSSQTVLKGEKAATPTAPTKDGYFFDKWYSDSGLTAEFDFSTAITRDITLYAKWKESVTVTFDANGGTGTMDPQVFAKGEPATLNKCLFTAPAGKTFGGWMLESGGTSADYADEALYPATEDKTLYALWVVDYLCFTAEAPNSVVQFKNFGTAITIIPVSLKYSTDTTTWSNYMIGSEITLTNVGDKVYFKAEGLNTSSFYETLDDYYRFVLTGKVAASGNIMSLVDASCESVEINTSNKFHSLFKDCEALTTAPKLPATILKNSCYQYMFSGCTSLETAPELPAMNLAYNCYGYMFSGCTSLETAPELPAMTLANVCYGSMFSGCTKLSYIKMLATDISAASCLNGWVTGVASTGTFVKNATMTSLPSGVDGIPSGWSVQDNP